MSEYFRRPTATGSAFFAASRFADGQARYRTGDRATVDDNGIFWLHGRLDRMLKRRGYRIELGEIEAVLSQCPMVRETAAFATYKGDEIQIGAVVVLYDAGQANALTLKVHCGRLLPPYMIPDSIEIIAEMPRTASGKVDLKRLGQKSAV
jgi:acyl-coenzyme A synthetase/AMP-(fatty) acid ligase